MLTEINKLRSELDREKDEHKRTIQDYESDADTKME